jgi:hypothetical protein
LIVAKSSTPSNKRAPVCCADNTDAQKKKNKRELNFIVIRIEVFRYFETGCL